MPPSKPNLPKTAAPRFGAHFDAWNSSSSGHQRPDNQPGTGWRDSRNQKLSSQFRGGTSGGGRLSDTWGAGSPDWDEKRKVIVPQTLRERKTGKKSVADMLMRPGRMQEVLMGDCSEGERTSKGGGYMMSKLSVAGFDEVESNQALLTTADSTNEQQPRRIFDGVVVYVNGSTFPMVSDHRLKQILSENGGNMSLHLGRRKVTHVIVGRPLGGVSSATGRSGRGAGGGLAGGKLEREIKRVGGCSVQFVGAEWVLESLKAGKRLPEARFASLKVAAQGQKSIYKRYAGQVTPVANSHNDSADPASDNKGMAVLTRK